MPFWGLFRSGARGERVIAVMSVNGNCLCAVVVPEREKCGRREDIYV